MLPIGLSHIKSVLQQRENRPAEEIQRFLETTRREEMSFQFDLRSWEKIILGELNLIEEILDTAKRNDRRFAHFPSNLLKSLDRGFPKSVMRSLQPIDFRGLIKMTEPWVMMIV
jgi:hypothetical protein